MSRYGTISILGRPNAGKSTLLNRLIGEKVSIVSPKPQTTRNRIVGILTADDTQMVFLDTPGLHKPQNRLDDRMLKTVYTTADDTDIALLVAQADKRPGKPEYMLLERIGANNTPCILVLNKVDDCKKEEILPIIAAYAEKYAFAAIVPLSALTGDGCDHLLAEITKLLPEGDHVFPDDALTDQSERVLCAELVREQLIRTIHEEIPHGLVCETERFEEIGNGKVEIDVLIVCEKASHKPILIGKQGTMLKQIGTRARLEMEKLLGAEVFLQLWVKVKEDWKNSPHFLDEITALREEQ